MPSTELAVIEPKTHPNYTPAEMRARSILSRMESLSAKLKTLEDDIRALWVDFDNLKAGDTILGCSTKAEFCEKRLNRTPRAIQYLLARQSNPADRPRSELSSPSPVSNREAARQEYKQAHPESSTESNREIDERISKEFRQRCEVAPETHWISPDNHCPTGKRGFDYPDDIWQAMRAEGTIDETDFVAYIRECGKCGRCHRDKDQSNHKDIVTGGGFVDESRMRHRSWYRPDELNTKPTENPKPQLLDGEPEPAENPEPISPESGLEAAVLNIPESPELNEAVEHPPEISAPKKSQSAKPDAKVESQLKKVQREWASIKNPAIGRITLTASNVGSGVETASGRYDLLLSGITPSLLKKIREILACK